MIGHSEADSNAPHIKMFHAIANLQVDEVLVFDLSNGDLTITRGLFHYFVFLNPVDDRFAQGLIIKTLDEVITKARRLQDI